jgi:glutamine synthetase
MTDLRWIKLSFVDVFGTINSMLLPASRFDDALQRGVVFDGSSLEGKARHFESDMRLWPIQSTLRDLGNGTGRVVCNVRTPNGDPWPGDPRTTLELIIEETGQLGATLTIGTELEFYALGANREPLDSAGYFDGVRGLGAELLMTAGDLLEARGVEVASGHHEAGPGQYEIDIAPTAGVAQADAIVLAKETIRETATRLGIDITFMPLPLGARPGSGMHIHQRSPLLIEPTGKLTPVGTAFVAGQIAHASGLCALAAPTVNSYRRLHAGPEAPSAAIWSRTARAALVRVSADLDSDASIEFRGADPAANPYLLIAGLTACGAAGIDADLDPGPPADESIGGYDPTTSTTRLARLPRSLDEALDALQADDTLIDSFDSMLLSRFIDGRRLEAEDFRATVTTWESEHYTNDL